MRACFAMLERSRGGLLLLLLAQDLPSAYA